MTHHGSSIAIAGGSDTARSSSIFCTGRHGNGVRQARHGGCRRAIGGILRVVPQYGDGGERRRGVGAGAGR